MDYGFKFEVGSFVRLAISANQTDATEWRNLRGGTHKELRGQVVERMLQECPGGVQRHYVIQFVRSDGAPIDTLKRHHEIELVASEPFPPNKTDDE